MPEDGAQSKEQDLASESADTAKRSRSLPSLHGSASNWRSEAYVVEELPGRRSAEAGGRATTGSTNRAEWVEHVAQMEDAPVGARFDAGQPDAAAGRRDRGVGIGRGWLGDTKLRRSAITAPEEAEFDGVFVRTTGR